MRIAKRFRQMIYASLICAAVISVTVFVGVNPMMEASSDANLATDQNNALLNVEIARLNHLMALTRNKVIVDSQLSELQTFMPEEPHVSLVVDALNNAANSNGLVVTSLTVGDPEKYVVPTVIHREQEFASSFTKAGNSVRDIPVTLTVDGKLQQILSFVDDVQNSDRVTLVRGLQIQPGATPGLYTLQIQALVFLVSHK